MWTHETVNDNWHIKITEKSLQGGREDYDLDTHDAGSELSQCS